MKYYSGILVSFIVLLNSRIPSLEGPVNRNKFSILIDINGETDHRGRLKETSYPITITIKNEQDTAVSFVAMTCSWEASFTTDKEGVHIEPNQCDSNFPERIQLAPHSSVIYTGFLHISKTLEGKPWEFRIGLREIPFTDFVFPNFPGKASKYKTYWSPNFKRTKTGM